MQNAKKTKLMSIAALLLYWKQPVPSRSTRLSTPVNLFWLRLWT